MSMLYGSPILMGDNTIPGVKYTPELEALIPKVMKACTDFGIEPYPSIVELLTYDEISEVAAYGGFPVRYTHWSHGAEYEQLSRGYEYGMHKIYEMVINTNPSYIYCLDSNPLIDHVTVVAHALFHSDFFRNNIYFEPTTQNALNELANNGIRFERYMNRWGAEKVVQFIDYVRCIDDLIDPAAAWKKRQMKDKVIRDHREYYHPRRLKLPSTNGEVHEHMDPWINDARWKASEQERIRDLEIRKQLNIFEKTEKDVVGYLVNHAPLNPWQQDILASLYRESQYFAPQGITKMINEGWASYGDYNIMARNRWANGDGIVHYARHKMGVLGGKYSMNPYALGFKLFLYIEEKWNKGRFGREFDDCQDAQKKADWDKQLGLGHEKVFEVRKIHNDFTMVHEFLDQEFIDKYQMYIWKKFPTRDGGIEYRIVSKDATEIKKKLMARYLNGGRPIIHLGDPNYAGKKIFMLEHKFDGRTLHPTETKNTLTALWHIWNNSGSASRNPVAIHTKDKDEKDIVYVCVGPKPEESVRMTRKQFVGEFAS